MEELHPASNRPGEQPSFPSILHEMTESLKSVIRSEFHVAKAEIKENGKYVARYTTRLAAFAAFAILGIFPFMAFLVVGLGRLLGDNFWLSSLIVAVVMFIIGGLGALAMLRKVKEADLRFDNTRRSVSEHLSTVDQKLHEVTDIAKARTIRRTSS
jgi:hypothetical protein